MRHFTHIDLGFSFGSFGSLCKEAIEIADKLDCKVSFDFNGVKINVTKTSDIDLMWERWNNAIKRKQTSCFGDGW